MKTKLLNNKKMNNNVYSLRRKVIKLIYDANKLIKLPRISVRICDDHEKILGVARMKENIIWITENSVASRSVVFHEILHAVFGQNHVRNCQLMDVSIDPKLNKKIVDRLFIKYAKKYER